MHQFVRKHRGLIAGMIIIYLLTQLFSPHFHFEHAGQDHQIQVHFHFNGSHESVAHGGHEIPPEFIEYGHEHEEEKNTDSFTWLGKKLTVLSLLVLTSLVLLLPHYRYIRPYSIKEILLQWRYLHCFSPPLRAPPL